MGTAGSSETFVGVYGIINHDAVQFGNLQSEAFDDFFCNFCLVIQWVKQREPSFRGVKAVGSKTYNSPPSAAEVKNMWS
jgi:hypothetical protein